MNGKILEEVYDRNAPYSDRVRIPFLFQGKYTTTRQSSHTTDSDTTTLSWADTSRRIRLAWWGVLLCMLMLKVAYLR